MRYLFLVILFWFGSSGIYSQSNGTISSLESAIKEGNWRLIANDISDSFRIGVYRDYDAAGMASTAINYYQSRLKGIDEKAIESEGKCYFTCHLKDGTSFDSFFKLDDKGKIVRIQFFEKLFGIQVGDKGVCVSRIPFKLVNSCIVIQLKLNENSRVLNMLFDTGADGMGLKKNVADSIGVFESRKKHTQVVGGSVQIGISESNTIVFDSLRIPNQRVALFPEFDKNLDGLFGGNLLKNFITFINFDDSVIELFSLGDMVYPTHGNMLKLIFSGGLPVISSLVRLNNVYESDVNLYFDTGANYSIILFGQYVSSNNLTKGFKSQFRGTTVSMGHITPTVSGNVDLLKLGANSINDFTGTLQLASNNNQSFNEAGDGSLGIEIIKKFNWYIDVYNRVFCFTPNKFYNCILPFYYGGVFFRLSEDKLVAIQVDRKPENGELFLQEGDSVVSINDLSIKELVDSRKLDQLKEVLALSIIDCIVSRGDVEFPVTLKLR
jgi:hypothetical protein